MPHFYVPPENIRGERFFLSEEESRHLATVLRKKQGDEISLFDGVDKSFRVRIDKVSPARVEGVILAEEAKVSLPWTLRLFQGMPKGDKFDWILEKATELGVSEIIPVYTERSVTRIPEDRLADRRRRWEKIVLAAAKQCGRPGMPKVSGPLSLEESFRYCPPGSLTLFPWEGEETRTLKSVLRAYADAPKGGARDINVFIGPEGGFSPGEVESALSRGAVSVSLGPLILRTETAGLFVASAVLYDLPSERS